MTDKIVVAGHICLDIIPRWEKGDLSSLHPGSLLNMDGIKLSTGGVVSNTGIDLKRLGFNTSLVGKIGNDYFGKIILDILQKEGEDLTDNMIVSPGETSSYSIVLNPPGTDRIFLHCPGANDTFTDEDIPYENLKGSVLFHFGYPPIMRQFYIDDGQHLKDMFKRVKGMGIITSLDMAMPDPNSESGKIDWNKLLQNVLPFVDIFLPSIDELLYMIDRENFDKLNRVSNKFDVINTHLLDKLSTLLLDMGANIIVIKLGNQGLYLRSASEKKLEKSAINKILDIKEWNSKKLISPCFDAIVAGTTGSGDATIAGFLAGIVKGVSPEMAAKIATAVGSYSVEVIDATSGIRPYNDVINRMKGWECMSMNIPHDGWERQDYYGDIYISNK